MFEHLSEWPRILVTGPQRSGTRVATAMIGHDTGHKAYAENSIATDSLYAVCNAFLENINLVIQAPALMRYAHRIGQMKGVFVVVMLRDVVDIIASQERIQWEAKWERIEKMRYGSEDDLPISTIKYLYWAKSQKDATPHYLELDYNSLSSHPLWVSKEKRANFDRAQIMEVQNGDPQAEKAQEGARVQS